MGLFGFGKERGIVDLGERYRREKEKASQMKKEAEEVKKQEVNSGGFFPFFASTENSNSSVSSETTNTNIENSAIDAVEKRKRLAKRLKDMTDRLEEVSNQIYKLQQRVDVLEKKNRNGY